MHRSKGENSLKNRWKMSGLVILCFIGFLLQGCAGAGIAVGGGMTLGTRSLLNTRPTVHEDVAFGYYSTLSVTRESTNLRVGMEKFVDKRPDKDRSATKSIADVDEKVTATLFEDFRRSQIFAAIDFPVQKEKDDLIMNGEIRRFYWKLSRNPIQFIPPINLLIFFAIPMYYVDGLVELQVCLVSSKTGETVAEYVKNSTRSNSYSLYTMDNFDFNVVGVELGEAFADVSKQIQEAIILDIRGGRLKMPQ
jgi:hypothetical protein